MNKSFPDYDVPQPDLEVTSARYAEFHNRLASARSAEDFLALITEWDRVICEFKEWSSLTYIRFHQDTTNPSYKSANWNANQRPEGQSFNLTPRGPWNRREHRHDTPGDRPGLLSRSTGRRQ